MATGLGNALTASSKDEVQNEARSNAIATNNADPFVDHAAPRHNRESLAALLAAVQQAVPPLPPSRSNTTMGYRSKGVSYNYASRRAQCTHMTMNRLHGGNPCQICGKVPDLGWLYACRQDWMLENQQDSVAFAAESAIVVPDESNYFDAMARFAASIKMSASVIQQIRDGQYTFDEVERLIAQKENLISVIKREEGLSTQNTPASLHRNVFQNHTNIIASIGLSGAPSSSSQQHPEVTPSSSTTAQPRHARKDSTTTTSTKQSKPKTGRCDYMVCHACRPFLQDRLYANIGSVVHGAFPSISTEEAKTLPVMDYRLAHNFGLRQAPSTDASSPRRLRRMESLEITLPDDYDDEISVDWTPSSNASGMYDDDHMEISTRDPYPCPGPGICPVYSRNSGCAYDSHDFDDGQRARNHGYGASGVTRTTDAVMQTTPDRPRARPHHVGGGSLSDTPGRSSSSTSSFSLPTPTTMPLAPGTPTIWRPDEDVSNKAGKAATVCGVLSPGTNLSHARLSVGSNVSGNDSHASFGSEVDVEGGVALTEEAVGTSLPDIVTET